MMVTLQNPQTSHNHPPAIARIMREFSFPKAISKQFFVDSRKRLRKFCTQQFMRITAQGFSPRVAVEFGNATGPQHDPVFRVPHQDLGQVQDTGLFAQRLFAPLPVGNIANNSGVELVPTTFNLRDGNLNGEFFTVGPQSA